MQSWSQWWRQLGHGQTRQAWGLAPRGGAWDLVGLKRHGPDLVKVHTSLSLQVPAHGPAQDLHWLSESLRQAGRHRGGARHRLNMALPAEHVLAGTLEFPAELADDDRVAEVQLEVAQALDLSPDQVSFDFSADPQTDGVVQRVHWVGCAQAQLTAFKNCTRAAGWRLASVEPQAQAAQRGVRALQGGVASLWTQPPQDWQFRILGDEPDAMGLTPGEPDAVIEEAIEHALSTPSGPRLVACGLALKAWL